MEDEYTSKNQQQQKTPPPPQKTPQINQNK